MIRSICCWSDLEQLTEPWLLLRRHSCWPCPLTPFSLWICKEFLITLYVCMECPKFLRQTVPIVHHKTHHTSASTFNCSAKRSRAAQVYQGNTSVLHVVFIFSILWVPKCDLSSVSWGLGCVENQRLHSHWRFFFFLQHSEAPAFKIIIIILYSFIFFPLIIFISLQPLHLNCIH